MIPSRKVLTKILSVRKKLIQTGNSRKNKAKCLSIIKELSIQIEAHEKKWDTNGWNDFAKRNIEKFLFLIPENKAGNSLKKQLHEI